MKHYLLFLLLLIFFSSIVIATGITMNPQEQTLNKGDTFLMEVNVTDVTSLSSFEFIFSFDNLQFYNLTEGTFLNENGGVATFCTGPTLYTSDSYIYTCIRWDLESNITNSSSGVSGSGNLALIEFNATTIPTFDNLRNFTHLVDTQFSESIISESIGEYWINLTEITLLNSSWDEIEQDSSFINGTLLTDIQYSLNDTSVFNIDSSTGLITNVTPLDETGIIYYLNISIVDDIGNENSGIFYINTYDSYPVFSDYYDNSEGLSGSGLGLFNVTVENTNGTVILTINNTDILATNLTSNMYNASYYFDSYGVYNYSWYSWSNESTNNYNESEVMNYIVVDDTTYPLFSSYYDDSGTLSGSGTGYFNVTVENTNGTVLLEIDGINITTTNLTSNVYNASYEFASSGIYNYLWHSWGNGTSEAYNNSGIRSYTVINSTINSCANLSSPNIIYKLSNNVNATGTCFTVSAQNITLDCQGYKVNYSSAGTSGYGVYSTQFNTTIKNCNIIEGTSASGNYHAVYFNGATNGAIQNNTISPSGQSARGILLTSGSNFNTLSNNIISTTAYGGEGISLSSNFNTLSNNIISTSGSYGNGIYLNSVSNNNFSNNTVSTSGYYGYAIYLSSSSNNNFTLNNISSNAMGFYLVGNLASYFSNKIENNNYVKNKLVNVIDGSENLEFDGVDFTQYGQVIVMNSRNITIKNSNISGNGITYANSNGTIENNNITQGTGFGVYLVYSKESNVINNIISTGIEGIKLSQYSDYNTISNNTVSTSGSGGDGYGVYMDTSSYNNLSSNTISSGGYGGEGVYLSSSSNNNFNSMNVSTSGNNGYGIYITSSLNNNIKHIIVKTSGSTAYGLYIRDDSYDNIIESSNFTTAGSTSYGVYIQTDKTNTTMADSIINALIVNDIYVGNDQDSGSFLKLINVSFDKSDVTILEPQTFDLIVQHYLDVNVTDFTTGSALQSANVKGYNNKNNLAFSELTSSSGFIPRQNITEYTQNITGKFFLTNYKINATLITYDDSVQMVNITDNMLLNIEMEGGVVPEDYEYPIFSNYGDNTGIVIGNGTGYFNVTVINTNGTVILHINGDNIPATNLTSNVYNASYYFSSSGIYSYNWTAYGNGTFRNSNISDNQYYIINAIIEDITPPAVNFTYPTPSSGTQSENSIYVNISSSDDFDTSTFVDFNNSLVFWMRMDEYNSTTVIDNSSYGNDGVVTGATYTSSGKFGGAYEFDGDADYITSSPQWNYSSSGFTYNIWIKSAQTSNTPISHSSSTYGGVTLYNNLWYVNNGAWVSVSADIQTDNEWYMYTCNWNGSVLTSYRNGNPIQSVNISNPRFYSDSVLNIGKDRPDQTRYFTGSLDEVMIFSRALSASEISSLYNSSISQYHNNFTSLADGNYTFKGYAMDTSGNINTTETKNVLISSDLDEGDTTPPSINFTYPTPSDGETLDGNSIYVNISSSDSESDTSTFVDFNNSLLGWWRMDEHNSTTVIDNSSYGRNGVITGATYNSSGKFGGAYDFDGVNDYVTVGTGSDFNMTGKNFSVSFWVKQSSATSNAVPVGKVTPASEGWMFYQPDAEELSFRVYNFDDDSVSMGESLPLNEWTHLVGLSNSTSTCIYKNGVLVDCDSKGVGNYVESGSALKIGRYDDYGNYFNGSIDEVMIFDRALSASEIASIYNSTANQYYNNFTSLSNGNYNINGYVMDTAGNLNTTEQRTVEVYVNTSSSGENNTYYVDSGATGSNNGNDWDNAWTGFSQINWNLINSGDTLYITGTFHETLDITKDGISVIGVNSPIIYGAEEAIGTAGDWSDLGSNIWQHSLGTSDYIFVWFEISGETLWGVYDSTPDSAGEWTKNGNSIQVYSASNPASVWDSMYYGDVDIGIKIDADDVIVSGIDVKYTKGLSTTGEYKSDGAIVVTPAHENISISNCHLQHVPLGFNAITTSNTITLNNVDVTGVYNPYLWPGGVGYMWYNHHIEAYNFTIAMDITTASGSNIRNGEGIRIPIDDSAAGYTTYFPDYSYIHDFDISGFSITGIKGSHQVDSGNREFNSFVISDGVIHDSVMSGSTSDDRDGIGFGGTSAHGLSGVVVERMKIYNVWHSGVKFVDNWYDCVIKNSIIYNVGYAGGNQAGIVINKGSYILFTTIDNYQDGYGIIVDNGGQSSRLSEIQYTSLSGGTDEGKVAITAVTANMTNLYYVNIYDTTHTDPDKLYGGIVGKVGVSYENPLFTNRAGNDYSLTSSSPFIDVSDSVIIPVNDDFDSAIRPTNDDYDIGAYEYTGEVTPMTAYPLFYNITDNTYSLNGGGTVTITSNIDSTNGTAGLEFNGINYTMSNSSSNFFNVSFVKTGEGSYNYYLWAYGNGTSDNYNYTTMSSYTINGSSCLVSNLTFQNFPLDEVQTGRFTFTYNATPDNDALDALVMLSDGNGSTFTDYAVLVRFNRSGNMDVMNYNQYGADNVISFVKGEIYEFRIEVDVPSKIFSAYVTPPGESEQTIAEDYPFRSTQSNITQIDNWGLMSDIGTIHVCGFNLVEEDTTPPTINFTYPTPSDSFSTMNTSIEINVSITEKNLKEVKLNWDGTNYSFLDSSTALFMNFNNISSLGENDTYVADLSINGNNGVITGTGGFVNDAERGTVLDLNGGLVNVSDSSSLDIQNEITLSAWINLRASSAYPKIFIKFASASDPWELYTLDLKSNTRVPRFILTDGIALGERVTANSSTALSMNEWHHVLGTYDGNNAQLYVDGVLIDSQESNIVIGTNDLPLFIGRTFNGTMDDVMILNRSLSFAEVQELYFSKLDRYNSTDWNLYVNQSKNSLEGLDEGIYDYQAFVSDNSGYADSTEQRTVTISSAPDFMPPYFISIPAGEEITYGTDWNGVQFNAGDENEINTYSVNDSRFSVNSSGFLDAEILGADNYFLNISVSDNSNNLNSTIYNLNITKAIPAGILTNNESWAEAYGTYVSITYSESNMGDSDLIYTIYRDSVSRGTEDTALLGVGEYTYVLNTTGGQNYTANSSMDLRTMTITSQSSVAILNFNETSSITYGTYLNITCNGELFMDDINVTDEIGNSVLLGAGIYSYSCKLYADGNHSYDDDNQTFIVNQNPNDFMYLLNGDSSSLSASYPQQINATILNNNTASAISLNGEALISGINYTIGAGTWTINYSVSGNQNYSSNEHLLTLSMNPASSSVYLYLNNSRSNVSVNYGNIVELKGVLNSGEGNVTLYVNNSIVNQGNNLGDVDYNYNFTIPGVYNVTALYFSTQNYSQSSETFYVTAVNSSVAPIISLLSPSEGASYTLTTTTFQYFVTDDSATNCSLILNGESINFDSSVAIDGNTINEFINSTPVSGYSWSINCTDIFNNQADSSLINFRITAAANNNNGNGGGGGGGGGGSPSNAGWTKTQVVTEEQFNQGSQKELEVKQRVKVTMGSEAHYVGILNITDNSAVIEIASDPMIITLSCGEERKLDCTGDGFYDMYIKLCDITDKKANLTIKSINEPVSVTGDIINEHEESSENASNESNGESHWWNHVIPGSFINNPLSILIPIVLIVVMGVVILSSSKSSRFLMSLKKKLKRRRK